MSGMYFIVGQFVTICDVLLHAKQLIPIDLNDL